jgi:hypothetical protein
MDIQNGTPESNSNGQSWHADMKLSREGKKSEVTGAATLLAALVPHARNNAKANDSAANSGHRGAVKQRRRNFAVHLPERSS